MSNPYQIEEFLRELKDKGVIYCSGDKWSVDEHALQRLRMNPAGNEKYIQFAERLLDQKKSL